MSSVCAADEPAELDNRPKAAATTSVTRLVGQEANAVELGAERPVSNVRFLEEVMIGDCVNQVTVITVEQKKWTVNDWAVDNSVEGINYFSLKFMNMDLYSSCIYLCT